MTDDTEYESDDERAFAELEQELTLVKIRRNQALRDAERLRTTLEAIVGLGYVNLSGRYEHEMRDIIRAMTDCARRALEEAP
jgi:hypothetical protein